MAQFGRSSFLCVCVVTSVQDASCDYFFCSSSFQWNIFLILQLMEKRKVAHMEYWSVLLHPYFAQEMNVEWKTRFCGRLRGQVLPYFQCLWLGLCSALLGCIFCLLILVRHGVVGVITAAFPVSLSFCFLLSGFVPQEIKVIEN